MQKKTEEILALADRIKRAKPDDALYFRISAAARRQFVQPSLLWLAAACLAVLVSINMLVLLNKNNVINAKDDALQNEYFHYLNKENREARELF